MATGLGPPPFWADMYIEANPDDGPESDKKEGFGEHFATLGATNSGKQMSPQWIAWFNKVYQLNK